jgi:hypothetical protein
MMGLLQRIKSIPRLLFLVQKLLVNLDVQRSYLGRAVEPFLQEAEISNDGSLDEADYKKIREYYGLAVPAILGEAFCELRGYSMNENERCASTCQGAMTGLFDDFFDKDKLSEEIIQDKIVGISSPLKKSNEQLFDIFYNKALMAVYDKSAMQESLQKVYKAQVDSKEQLKHISVERLLQITVNKGGSSLQFYRTAFSHPLTSHEDEMLYQAGGVMQMANDIFDINKDLQNNINTFVTTAKHINDVRIIFNSHLESFYSAAINSHYPQKNVRKFSEVLSLGIFSRCFVCLDHLEKNESLTSNEFQPQKYNRQQLVCDMDTKKNMLHSAAYHLKTFPF